MLTGPTGADCGVRGRTGTGAGCETRWMATDRAYDLVLFGATGFTGALTARYLARHAPPGTRWALAGRDPAKLAALRTALTEVDPDCARLPLLRADATDPDSLAEVAGASRAVLSTVGPFLLHGEPLVAACAAAGTDYLDITGEPEFVDLMYLRHHETALRTGARLVHACGFDSIPPDLGVYFTVRELSASGPITVDGYVRGSGAFSAGTYRSVLLAVSRQAEAARAARQRRRTEPRPEERRVRGGPGRLGRAAEAGLWALPLPTIDPAVVRRSAAALPAYGPDFRYRHHLGFRRLPAAVGTGIAAGGILGLGQLARVPAARRWLLERVRAGSGPSEQRRARGWFKVRFVGRGDGRQVVTEVSGGDPGYDETAKMLAESGLCLLFDDVPGTAGQVTSAAAMGDALIERLTRAGITFRVVTPAHPLGSPAPPDSPTPSRGRAR